MHNFNALPSGYETQGDADPASDRAYLSRMAWIASLWAMLALAATAVALWDGWRALP